MKGNNRRSVMSYSENINKQQDQIRQDANEKNQLANEEKGNLFGRNRLKLLFDNDLNVEDAVFANCMADDLPADGVVTGIGKINGQTVCVMANDSTVKAGSWGKHTVEKIIRIQETAQIGRAHV